MSAAAAAGLVWDGLGAWERTLIPSGYIPTNTGACSNGLMDDVSLRNSNI